ncbi:MAG: rod shape-determining protein MreD [Gammaproteobacteria bacterium]
MSAAVRHPTWPVVLSMLVGLSLEVTPLPGGAAAWAPPWLALAVIYWSLAYPRRYGLGLAWSSGLVLDVLKGGLLGQHALALTVVALIAVRFHLRFRLFPIWQQAGMVGLVAAIHEFLIFWVDGLAGEAELSWQRLIPPVTAALLWPPATAVLDRFRRWLGMG